MHQQRKTVLVSSIVIIGLTLFASLMGIKNRYIYNDSPTFITIWQSNDLITLIMAIPLFILAIVMWYKNHSIKSLLVWMSILWYMIYNFAYYVYGAAFNDLYLIHLVIYTLSIGSLIIGLSHFPTSILEKSIKPTFSRKIVIAQMLFVAIGLTVIYTMQSLLYVFNDTLPAIIEQSGHVTSVVFTIDFSMVVLFFVMGAVLLIKKNAWGYVIAFLGNLKGVIYMSVLTLASLRTNPDEAMIWIILGLLSLVSVILLWVGLKNTLIKKID